MNEIIEALKFINPADCTYEEWVHVGMAIQSAGGDPSVWDQWSSRDSARYHSGECDKKWNSFQSNGITENTLFKMAADHGYRSPYSYSSGNDQSGGHELAWDDVIPAIVDKAWIEQTEFEEPSDEEWNPIEDITKYISTLFESTENVGYVTTVWQNEVGKYLPQKGNYDRTAGELLQLLRKAKTVEDVFLDYKKEAGAWIRFNPVDGQGVKNDNVTDFRYALVESDSMDLAMQNTIIRKLELPVACLVYSGKKSIHAIVHIDAGNYDEYRKRVNYLYDVCQKNGMEIDGQNKNPSRLSRMPGFRRGDRKQFLMATNIGKKNWQEWEEWIEGINDDLPDPESLATDWNSIPDLAPSLIDGVLRQGHKMLLSGPSKAGKSFALIELCVAIAEGTKWLQWPCAQGRVMYVNLELDRASCLHRFKDVYTALGIAHPHTENIVIWNLRGNAVPMDKLAPKLIRRAQKEKFIAVVIDPIYKVITGDENSAEQMSKFCNQFDNVATSLECAVIYCHHHSKGNQGSKRAMDRASGSGVFARDPDAMLDLTELPIDDEHKTENQNRMVCLTIKKLITDIDKKFFESKNEADLYDAQKMKGFAWTVLRKKYDDNQIEQIFKDAEKRADIMTAWRIDLTLREYAKPGQTDIWFDYPIHQLDDTGMLTDLVPESDMAPWVKGNKKMSSKDSKDKNKKNRMAELDFAFDEVGSDGGPVTISLLAEEMQVTERTVWRYIKESGHYLMSKKVVGEESTITRKP